MGLWPGWVDLLVGVVGLALAGSTYRRNAEREGGGRVDRDVIVLAVFGGLVAALGLWKIL